MRFKTNHHATATGFYILSLLLFFTCTVVSPASRTNYILTLLSTGQLGGSGNLYNIFSYYMTNSISTLSLLPYLCPTSPSWT